MLFLLASRFLLRTWLYRTQSRDDDESALTNHPTATVERGCFSFFRARLAKPILTYTFGFDSSLENPVGKLPTRFFFYFFLTFFGNRPDWESRCTKNSTISFTKDRLHGRRKIQFHERVIFKNTDSSQPRAACFRLEKHFFFLFLLSHTLCTPKKDIPKSYLMLSLDRSVM